MYMHRTSTKSVPTFVAQLILLCVDKNILSRLISHSNVKGFYHITHFLCACVCLCAVICVLSVQNLSCEIFFSACCYICAAIIISNMLPCIILWTRYFFNEMGVSFIGLATMFSLFLWSADSDS